MTLHGRNVSVLLHDLNFVLELVLNNSQGTFEPLMNIGRLEIRFIQACKVLQTADND